MSFVIVAIAVFAGCASPDDASPGVNDPSPDGMPMAPPVAMSVSLVDRTPGVGVPPTTMGISPAQLELAVGVPVNLTVTNDGNSAHDLVIDGLDVATDSIPPGENVSIEFTPTTAGEYEMYCSIGGATPVGHREQGMRGIVTVA